LLGYDSAVTIRLDSWPAPLRELLDDLVASEEIREALAVDTGERVELAEVARESGFDPREFGLK
jgi:hypothetical protein